MILSKITDKDRGLKALFGQLKNSKHLVLTVGVHGPEGSEPHEGGGITVAQLATIHEFGLGRSPERSFIRAWADEKQADHMNALRAIGREVLKGTYSAMIGLERLGVLFVGEIQARISGGISPPLMGKTIERKGSSVPLIDTGQLRSSIRYRIKKEGEDF